jgi:hypothetical protein
MSQRLHGSCARKVSGRTTPWLGAIVGTLFVAAALTGCAASPTKQFEDMAKSGFSEHAKRVCTATGASTYPLHGSVRVAATAGSSVGKLRGLVFKSYSASFANQIGALGDDTYVALCFLQLPSSRALPSGRIVVAELDGGRGSSFVGRW